MDYRGLWAIVDYPVLSYMILKYHDYHGLSWIIVGDHGLLWTIMEYGLSLVIMDYGRSCAITDDRELLWITVIIVHCHGFWSIMDYHELSWISVDDHGFSRIMNRLRILDYSGLSSIVMDYELSCVVVDYHGLSRIGMDYRR